MGDSTVLGCTSLQLCSSSRSSKVLQGCRQSEESYCQRQQQKPLCFSDTTPQWATTLVSSLRESTRQRSPDVIGRSIGLSCKCFDLRQDFLFTVTSIIRLLRTTVFLNPLSRASVHTAADLIFFLASSPSTPPPRRFLPPALDILVCWYQAEGARGSLGKVRRLPGRAYITCTAGAELDDDEVVAWDWMTMG